MRGISKAFPGVKALDRVDLTVRAGEIHALLGENGAGKSTLIRVLTGVYPRDAGEIRLDGKPVNPRTPIEAQAFGISVVHQEVNLVPYLSVAENLALGRQPKRLGVISWREMNRRARESLERLGVSVDVALPLNSYSVGIQQMVATARALDVQAKLLVLDEPTSSLDAAEVQKLFEVMRMLKQQGLGIVFVSHFLEQVYAVSDRMTVLRNGKLVGERDASLPRLELIAMMLGRDLAEVEALTQRRGAPRAKVGDTVLRATGLGRRGAMQPLDLEVRGGEALGLAGLLGSGRTETARMLFGIDRADAGTVEVDGKRARIRSPRQAMLKRIGFCPEDRKAEAIVPSLSVRENIVLAMQARRGWLRRYSRAQQLQFASKFIQALGIATPDAEKPVGQLSGGNQQKVVLARWLASQPKLLILDEPTRGIDVGAKAAIEDLIAELCEKGIGILFISSDIEEVVRDSHRVAVLRDRRKVGELEGDQVEEGAIMRLIAAHDEPK